MSKNDPNSPFYKNPMLPEPRIIKSYFPTFITDVLYGMEISYEVHKPDLGSDSVTIHFNANRDDFRAARYEWLQRMSVQIVTTVETTEGLFA